MRRIWVACSTAAALACTPPVEGIANLALTANPKTIDDKGQQSTLAVEAVDEAQKPGSGVVSFTSTAGQVTPSFIQLDGSGKGTATFTCAAATDARCKGDVRVTAEWDRGSKKVSQFIMLTVGNAGTGGSGGSDGGTGGGAGGGSGADCTTNDAATLSRVANIVYVADGVKALLGVKSSGREVQTPIAFRVIDSAQQPTPGVCVEMTTSGAGGAVVQPARVRTNASGIALSTLQSGDEVGVVTVRATILNSQPQLSTNHPGTPIVAGKPSDRGLSISCDKLVIGALNSVTPPRIDQATDCRATLVDRSSNPVGLKTTVQWFAESGAIASPVESEAQSGFTPSATTGIAKTVFRSGNPMPQEVTPDSASNEPSNGAKNPRDMLVTIIAVVGGEEEFVDGSKDGVKDGMWNPGEWFVDLPEPFIDTNDNGVCDPNEFFIDTDRRNCATGQIESKNGQWDGPNGCWDADTQIWRVGHVVYSGAPSVYTFTPAITGTVQVPVSGVRTFGLVWGDAYLNRMSPDGAGIKVSQTPSTRGTVTFASDDGFNARGYGFGILYETRRVDANGNDLGACDTSQSPGGTCRRRYRFSGWGRGNYGTIELRNATTPQTSLPDGGTPPPVMATVRIESQHQLATPSVITFDVAWE